MIPPFLGSIKCGPPLHLLLITFKLSFVIYWSSLKLQILTSVSVLRPLRVHVRHSSFHTSRVVRGVVLETLAQDSVLVTAPPKERDNQFLSVVRVSVKSHVSCRLPPHEEVSQTGEEGPQSHDQTAPWNEPRSVQLGPKMADHSQKQQVAWLPKEKARNQRIFPRPLTHGWGGKRYPSQNCHLSGPRAWWRCRNVSRSAWWSSSCVLPSEISRNRRRTAPKWISTNHREGEKDQNRTWGKVTFPLTLKLHYLDVIILKRIKRKTHQCEP